MISAQLRGREDARETAEASVEGAQARPGVASTARRVSYDFPYPDARL